MLPISIQLCTVATLAQSNTPPGHGNDGESLCQRGQLRDRTNRRLKKPDLRRLRHDTFTISNGGTIEPLSDLSVEVLLLPITMDRRCLPTLLGVPIFREFAR